MNKAKFQVGIVGCGNIFPMHAQSLVNIPRAKLACVCDIRPERARLAGAKYHCPYYADYQKMLEKVKLDALHILTPHYLHPRMAISALNKKINVLVEKPLCIDPREGEKMIAAARNNKVKLGVIFQNRFNPGAQLAKTNLLNGKLGRIKAARMLVFYHKPDTFYLKSDWKGRRDLEGGGVLIDQAIHFIDLVRWLVNDEVEFIEATTRRRMHKTIEVEDLAEGLIQFRQGAYACFYFINYYSFDADHQIELDCTKGRAEMIRDSGRVILFNGKVLKANPKPGEYIDYGKGRKDYWGFCHWIQIKEFYQALRENRQPEVNGEEGLATQKIIWNIYKSARSGKRIYL
jgi:predicted dehydrogenase